MNQPLENRTTFNFATQVWHILAKDISFMVKVKVKDTVALRIFEDLYQLSA